MLPENTNQSTDKPIPLSVPEIQGNEWKYIKECLDTSWVSSVGSYVDKFEKNICDYTGSKYAVAVVNGTAAIHTALMAAGIEHDDEVLMPSLTFIAPANAIRYIGAWPVFIDAEPEYWQMDPQLTKDFLLKNCNVVGGKLQNKSSGRRIKALMPVHILGHPIDMTPIIELAIKYDLVVIEDATEGLGAMYKGKKLGTIGDIGCFSFNGNKIITTGGGGMIVTDNKDWAARAKYLSTQAKDNPIEYIHNEIGYNYRLTNLQAAMGCAQLEQLDTFISKKREIASRYSSALCDIPGIQVLGESPNAFSIYWLYSILVDENHYDNGSRQLLQALRTNNIQARPLWQPIHCSPPYKDCQHIGGQVAEKLNREALSIPCSAGLLENHQDIVIDSIKSFCS